MLKTEIQELDKIISRKIPEGSCILILGTPREKRIFSLKFLKNGLKEGYNCIFISTEGDIENIEREIKDGLDFEVINERLRLIDCHTGIENSPYIYSSSPETLCHLNVVIMQSLADLMNSDPRRCVFDSISKLFSFNKPEKVLNFLKSLKDCTERFKTTCVFTLDKELQGDENIEKIKKLADVIIEVKSEDNNIFIKISKAPLAKTIDWTKVKLN